MQIPKCRNLVLIQHPFQQTQENVDSRKNITLFCCAHTRQQIHHHIAHRTHNPTDRLKTLHGFFSSAPRHNRAADDWTAAVILYYTYIFFRDSTAAVREDSNNIIRSFWPPWKWKIISTLFFPSSILLFSAAQHSKNGEECRGKEESEQNGEENTSKHFVDHKTLHFFSTHNNLHSLLQRFNRASNKSIIMCTTALFSGWCWEHKLIY